MRKYIQGRLKYAILPQQIKFADGLADRSERSV